MDLKNIDLYFFSGTGNTFLAVKKMQKTFEKNGINVNLYRIEDSDPEKVNLDHTIGLGFPIAELSTYDFVWKFMKSLPQTNGTEIFMVDTLAGFSGGLLAHFEKLLKRKDTLQLVQKKSLCLRISFILRMKRHVSIKLKKDLSRLKNMLMIL